MGAQRIGDDRLDHVAVCARQPQRVAGVLLGETPIMLAHRLHRPGLHMGQAFAVGEHRGARLLLHHGPQRLFDQVTYLAAGPLAVVHL